MANPIVAGTTNSVTTTDATQTTLFSHEVAEGETVVFWASVVGQIANLSASAGRVLWVVARRASGGNVTLVGSVQGDSIQEDSAGTPAITLDVDTSTQTVRIRVTGIASETWTWYANYNVSTT